MTTPSEAAMQTLTLEEIRGLAQKARAATPGPWTLNGRYVYDAEFVDEDGDTVRHFVLTAGNFDNDRNDAAYLAALDPSTLLRLLAAYRDMAIRAGEWPCTCGHKGYMCKCARYSPAPLEQPA